MIAYYLILILLGLVGLLLSPLQLLPDAALAPAITASFATAAVYIAAIYQIFPYTLTAFISVLGVAAAVEGGILTYKLAMWVIKKIPGVS